MLRPVAVHELAYEVIELLLMAFIVHVDEIDDDDAADIAQTQLMYQLLCCQHVKLEGILLLVLVDLLAAGIDINGEQCFGFVDNEVTSMLKTDRSAESRLHLAGDVEMVKDRLRAVVKLHDLRALGCDEFQILPYFVVDIAVIDLDGGEVGTEDVADNTERTSHLFANQTDGFFLLQGLDGLLPPLHEQP